MPSQQPVRTPALLRQSLAQDSKNVLAHDGADFTLGETLFHKCLGYQADSGGVKGRGGCSIKVRTQANMLYAGDLSGALDGASNGGGIGSADSRFPISDSNHATGFSYCPNR